MKATGTRGTRSSGLDIRMTMESVTVPICVFWIMDAKII